jgi:hypothetical protein
MKRLVTIVLSALLLTTPLAVMAQGAGAGTTHTAGTTHHKKKAHKKSSKKKTHKPAAPAAEAK